MKVQASVEKTLEAEIDNVSMRLSHLCNVNNSDVLALAAQTDDTNAFNKYNFEKILRETFNYIMIPSDDMLGSVFYMASGAEHCQRAYGRDSIYLSHEGDQPYRLEAGQRGRFTDP